MNYAKGNFHTFRAVTKIHLGAISDNLHEGEEVEYDGTTMKRGGAEVVMPNLRAAISIGWLVPSTDTTSKYVPQPAGVKVHRADGSSKEVVDLTTVSEEDVEVGGLNEVRGKDAPATHRASNASKVNPSEGTVVAKFKTAAKQGPVEIGKDDRQVVKALTEKSKVDIERVAAVATGDVEEAISGEALTDLLPNAASTGTPKPGLAGDVSDIDRIRQFIPGFEWDLSVQWAKRVKLAVEKYAHIPVVIDYIRSVETETVRSRINAQMAKR